MNVGPTLFALGVFGVGFDMRGADASFLKSLFLFCGGKFLLNFSFALDLLFDFPLEFASSNESPNKLMGGVFGMGDETIGCKIFLFFLYFLSI